MAMFLLVCLRQCIPGDPGTCYLVHVGLELTEPPSSGS